MCLVKVKTLKALAELAKAAMKSKDDFTITMKFESQNDDVIQEVVEHIKDGGLE